MEQKANSIDALFARAKEAGFSRPARSTYAAGSSF